MNSRLFCGRALVLAQSLAVGAALSTPSAGQMAYAGSNLSVTGVEPTPRSVAAPQGAAIVVHFDRPVRPESFAAPSAFWAFGRWSGTVQGALSFSNGNQTVTLTPDQPFSGGENVLVILSHDIEAVDGTFLRNGGYSFQFWISARPASLEFIELQRLTTRTVPQVSSRAYGGIGTDLDGDRHLDLTIINEDTADLRVFMNQADGTGLFEPFIQPTFPVGNQASPSEPADFDHDGLADICVANIADNTVSVVLGNGDGTFAPQQLIGVGSQPRGIAVLDVDGDGDIDIVNTNRGNSNLSLLVNNGSGVFGAPIFFEGGGPGERALAAADMDEDGILDLVVGAQVNSSTSEVRVLIGNGDGTFTHQFTRVMEDGVWMLVIGDVNGDGHEDAAAVNSSSNQGVILMGDGAGQVSPADSYPADPFPLATDLGDLDGDGDLDWVTSSYGGDWYLFLNDGAGQFTFEREFLATQSASCSVILDIDRDGDLDLALIDELEDEVIVLSNGGPALPIPTVGGWGMVAMVLSVAIAGTLLARRRLELAAQR